MYSLMIFHFSTQMNIQTMSATPERTFGLPLSRHSTPRGNHSSDFYHSRFVWLFLELNTNGIILNVVFWVWLLSLNIVSLRFIHVVEYGNSVFLLLLCVVFCDMNIPNLHNLFILLLMDFQLFLIFHYYTKSATDIFVHFFGRCMLSFLLGIYIERDVLGYSIGLCLALVA